MTRFLLCLAALAACTPAEQPAPPPTPNIADPGQPSPVSGRLIGPTVAEVSVEETGAWLSMAGIQRVVNGWVVDQETGQGAQVELRPGDDARMDRISLDAVRALGVDQARVVVLDVYYDERSL